MYKKGIGISFLCLCKLDWCRIRCWVTVHPKKYAHGFVVLCFVVVMQSFIMNSHEVFIHIHQGCFAGTGAIVRLPQCQWSKPDGYGKISQCITTTKHNKAKTVCIFLGIYCICTLFSRHIIITAFKMTIMCTKITSKIAECNWQKCIKINGRNWTASLSIFIGHAPVANLITMIAYMFSRWILCCKLLRRWTSNRVIQV